MIFYLLLVASLLDKVAKLIHSFIDFQMVSNTRPWTPQKAATSSFLVPQSVVLQPVPSTSSEVDQGPSTSVASVALPTVTRCLFNIDEDNDDDGEANSTIASLNASTDMESFIVQTMIKQTVSSTPNQKPPNKRVINRNAELLTAEHFLNAQLEKAAASNKPSNKNTKTKKSAQTNLNEESNNNAVSILSNSSSSSSSVNEVVPYDDSEDTESFGDEKLQNEMSVNFVKRNIPPVEKIQTEKLYIIGYYNQSKTKLYVGKIKSVDCEKKILLVEFMDQKADGKFTWKNKPPVEEVSSEQVVIGPLKIHYDHGIIINGLPRAREQYINYVKGLTQP